MWPNRLILQQKYHATTSTFINIYFMITNSANMVLPVNGYASRQYMITMLKGEAVFSE